MSFIVISSRVAGAAHKFKNAECQDSHKVDCTGNIIILAAADGHGSESCPHSKIGAEIATDVFHAVMKEYTSSEKALKTYLEREGGGAVARVIDAEWKRRVTEVKPMQRSCPQTWKLYGTTLLGLVLAPTFYFAFQLGDGDMLSILNGEVYSVIRADKILGIETHSLSRENAWEKAITKIGDLSAAHAAFMLATDGFANSYPSESAFFRTCAEYYMAIKEHGFAAVQSSLSGWLEETSERGSGDDITMLFAVRSS